MVKDESTKQASSVPFGKPKSGRTWKVRETCRASTFSRQGVLSHMSKSLEVRKREKEKKEQAKAFENFMKEEKKMKSDAEKERREENKRRRTMNEYKNSVYQVINPEKIKNMSKKQLRMIKKTSVNKSGQVELVNPWSNKA